MSCHPERGCITCGDVAVEMRVIRVQGESGLATCASEAGEHREIETALVGDVAPGDVVLVHADVAITKTEGPAQPDRSSEAGRRAPRQAAGLDAPRR